MDPQVYIDAARYAHIITVAIGFGAAFMADYHIISRLGRPVDNDLTTTLHLCHSLIWKMVIGMWGTGLILIGIRTGFVFENFTPKLISKLVTVAILTVNAMLISKVAMPLVEENRGRSLMWLPLSSKLCLAGIGAVSSASWMLALAMGSSKVLAASGWIVFAILMPFVYFSGVFVAVAVMYLLHLGSQMVAYKPKTREATVAPQGSVAVPTERPIIIQPALAPRIPPNGATVQTTAPQTAAAAGIPPERRAAIASAAAHSVATKIAADHRIPAGLAAE